MAVGNVDSTSGRPPVGHGGLEEAAGTGGHEVRTWLIGAAAVAQPVVWTAYEPVPEWITGMGIATSFVV